MSLPSSPSTSAGPLASPTETATPTRWQRIARYRLLLSLALFVFVLDQITKLAIIARLPFPTYPGSAQAIPVIDGFFYLAHVGNTGAAWSMFAGKSVYLAALALITLVGIYYWRKTLCLHLPIVQLSFGLLCGGIVGNLVDRMLHKHVVDFIDLHFGDYIYPTFNIADSGICVGVIVYLLWSLRAPQSN